MVVEKGKTYSIEVLKDTTVCQATKKPSQTFSLKKGQVLTGTWGISTVEDKYVSFVIPELGDEIFFSGGEFKATPV